LRNREIGKEKKKEILQHDKKDNTRQKTQEKDKEENILEG